MKLPPNFRLPAVKLNMPVNLVIKHLQSALADCQLHLQIHYKPSFSLYAHPLRITYSAINNLQIGSAGVFVIMQ